MFIKKGKDKVCWKDVLKAKKGQCDGKQDEDVHRTVTLTIEERCKKKKTKNCQT